MSSCRHCGSWLVLYFIYLDFNKFIHRYTSLLFIQFIINRYNFSDTYFKSKAHIMCYQQKRIYHTNLLVYKYFNFIRHVAHTIMCQTYQLVVFDTVLQIINHFQFVSVPCDLPCEYFATRCSSLQVLLESNIISC